MLYNYPIESAGPVVEWVKAMPQLTPTECIVLFSRRRFECSAGDFVKSQCFVTGVSSRDNMDMNKLDYLNWTIWSKHKLCCLTIEYIQFLVFLPTHIDKKRPRCFVHVVICTASKSARSEHNKSGHTDCKILRHTLVNVWWRHIKSAT